MQPIETVQALIDVELYYVSGGLLFLDLELGLFLRCDRFFCIGVCSVGLSYTYIWLKRDVLFFCTLEHSSFPFLSSEIFLFERFHSCLCVVLVLAGYKLILELGFSSPL